MKKSDKIALSQKAPSELQKLLSGYKKDLVESKSRQYLGNQKDTSVFKKISYQISLVNSLLKKPQNGDQK